MSDVSAGRRKLQHSPSLVALGLSVGHETCMASNWLFYWLWALLSFPPEFPPPVFRCHWQCPCTTPGNSSASEWYVGGCERVYGRRMQAAKMPGVGGQMAEWLEARETAIGERQEAQILKFNAPPPYTLSLSCPSYSKFSQLSYKPGCSCELWCRKCATWLWNKYVLIFSKTLFYTHIQSLLLLRAQNAIKQCKWYFSRKP